MVVEVDGEQRISHTEGGCSALSATAPYRCGVHAARPFICRDFPVGGDACLEARRFMGVS
jgi:Fe-S-cluster containining protein